MRDADEGWSLIRFYITTSEQMGHLKGQLSSRCSNSLCVALRLFSDVESLAVLLPLLLLTSRTMQFKQDMWPHFDILGHTKFFDRHTGQNARSLSLSPSSSEEEEEEVVVVVKEDEGEEDTSTQRTRSHGMRASASNKNDGSSMQSSLLCCELLRYKRKFACRYCACVMAATRLRFG
jgi:hypothetical protein